MQRSGNKISYMSALPGLKKAIADFQPDIVHAHYATSYGLLGARAGFHPFILSVWGSDVYDFPRKSILHKTLLKFNLRHADVICSTSQAMGSETAKYTGKKIEVTPFGIDLEKFRRMDVPPIFEQGDIVMGTIKSLEKKYGIDILIRAFSLLKRSCPGLSLKLLIVGDGTEKAELEKLCATEGITGLVKFAGKVSMDEVPVYHNYIDVFVSLSVSDSESFGVSAVEAAACEKPVIVSDVDGFKEVVRHNETGIIVPRNDVTAAAEAMKMLISDPEKAKHLGANGRKRVEELYNWNDNLETMLKIYERVLKK
jgi:L-malate glycosyltransferase